jgi:hypothetical protein
MDLMFPIWQLPYLDAVSRGSRGSEESLRERVDDAESAILKRSEQLSRISGREIERFAIGEALDALYIIKRDKLDCRNCGQSPVSLL